jgi:hypothetical protein
MRLALQFGGFCALAAAGSSSARVIVTASAVTMVRVKVHILVIHVLLFGAR